MMYVLLLAAERLTRLQLSTAIPEILLAPSMDGDQFTFVGTESFNDVRFQHIGSDLEDWQDEPVNLERLAELGGKPEVYAVHFENVDRLGAVLSRVANNNAFYIDDDHGLFIRGDAFARRWGEGQGGTDWFFRDSGR